MTVLTSGQRAILIEKVQALLHGEPRRGALIFGLLHKSVLDHKGSKNRIAYGGGERRWHRVANLRAHVPSRATKTEVIGESLEPRCFSGCKWPVLKRVTVPTPSKAIESACDCRSLTIDLEAAIHIGPSTRVAVHVSVALQL